MSKETVKIEAHIRLEGELAAIVRDRAETHDRTINAEIRRALRIAYKLGVNDDRATPSV